MSVLDRTGPEDPYSSTKPVRPDGVEGENDAQSSVQGVDLSKGMSGIVILRHFDSTHQRNRRIAPEHLLVHDCAIGVQRPLTSELLPSIEDNR